MLDLDLPFDVRKWHWLIKLLFFAALIIIIMWVVWGFFHPPPQPKIVEVELDGFVDIWQLAKGMNWKELEPDCPSIACSNHSSISFWGNITFQNGITQEYRDGRQLNGYIQITRYQFVTNTFPHIPLSGRFKGEITEFAPSPLGALVDPIERPVAIAFALLALYYMRRKVIGPAKEIDWAIEKVTEKFCQKYGGSIIGEIFGRVDNQYSPNYYIVYFLGRVKGNTARYYSTVDIRTGAVRTVVPITPEMQRILFREGSLEHMAEIERTQRIHTPADLEAARKSALQEGIELGKAQVPRKRLSGRESGSFSSSHQNRDGGLQNRPSNF